MNDLHNKNETINGGLMDSDDFPPGLGKPTTAQLYYQKLGAYLLLLYQSYLKGETTLEPAIKMALLRMVQFNKDFPSKIRMAQLDILNKEFKNLNAAWDDASEVLFPIETDEAQNALDETHTATILEYKEAILTLLASKI